MRVLAVHDGDTQTAEYALFQLSQTLFKCGMVLAGAVQKTKYASDGAAKEMQLFHLATKQVTTISLPRSPGATGCQLDHMALQEAGHQIASDITEKTQLVLLSKFGQRENEGGGLRDALIAAAERDCDVIIGVAPVRRTALSAFLGFTPDYCVADPDKLLDWIGAH